MTVASPGARTVGPVGSIWSEIERIWLDVQVPPLLRRLAEAGWTADQAGDYCLKCGERVGPFESDADGCAACFSDRLPWERLVRLGHYGDPLKGVVHDIKFTAWEKLGEQAGRLLGIEIAAQLERYAPGRPVAVVPVPTSLLRRIGRRTDHSMAIARGVCDQIGGRPWAVLARRHRLAQARLAALSRRRNVAGSMRLAAGIGVRIPWVGAWPRLCRRMGGRSGEPIVVVVDDVKTTGATLRETCRALRRGFGAAGVMVPTMWVGVIAVTEDKARK